MTLSDGLDVLGTRLGKLPRCTRNFGTDSLMTAAYVLSIARMSDNPYDVPLSKAVCLSVTLGLGRAALGKY
jgi:hypothetical protein